MPAITVTGLGSGIQTDEIIQKLKEVERQPIVKMEQERNDLSYEIEALKELRNRTKNLQESLKVLYGFDSALSQNKLVSQPEGFVSALLTGAAKEGEHEIFIDRMAQRLSFNSRYLKSDELLSAATISVNGTEHRFEGGGNIDLVNFLNKHYSELLSSRLVQVNKNFLVIAIDGKQSGKPGLLRFGDPNGLLAQLELVNPSLRLQEPQPKEDEDLQEPQAKKDEIDFPLLFTGDKLWVVQEGHMQIKEQSTVLELGEQAARRMEIKKEAGQENLNLTALAVRAYLQKELPPAQDTTPYSLKDGHSQKAVIAGVELETYNITRTRPLDSYQEKNSDYGVILHYQKPKFPGQETESEEKFSEKISLQGRQVSRLDVKPGLVAVDFYTDNAKVQFSNIRTIYEIGSPVIAAPPTNENEDPDIALQKLMFPHLLTPAVNAIFTFDGVKVEREQNTDIMDLIPGATVSLLHKSDKTVHFEIVRDVEKAIEKIKNFVNAHNDLVHFTTQVAKPSTSATMPNEFDKMKKEMGILTSNSTVRNLMTGLQQKLFSVYYTLDNKNVRILSAIGISSGSDRSEWQNLQGALKLDEAVLRTALQKYPEEVENFLAYDHNGDFRFDDGVAFLTYVFLEPYSRDTGGLITAQIHSKSDQITAIGKEIARLEEHVQKYEENLKKKFGYMDSVVRQQRSTGDFLKNKFRNKD